MADYVLVPIHVQALLVRLKTVSLYPVSATPPPAPTYESNLKPGVHLHWFLPAALTKGVVDGDKMRLPSVPNRWLVTRHDRAGAPAGHWVVESDYINLRGETPDAVTYYPSTEETSEAVVSCRIGRSLPQSSFASIQPVRPDPDRYLRNLTAQGYGLPTFASFYPQCRTVFGLHDESTRQWEPNLKGYSVIGWYSDLSKDILRQRYAAKLAGQPQATRPTAPPDAKLIEAVLDELKWQLQGAAAAGPAMPERSIFYGMVTEPLPDFEPDVKEVAFADSGGEALAAYLAHELAGGESGQKARVEEQLDFLSVYQRLAAEAVDRQARFDESLHEMGFSAVSGGAQWVIVKDVPPAAGAVAGSAAGAGAQAGQQQVALPVELAGQLDALNNAQRALDRVQQEIRDLQQQDALERRTLLLRGPNIRSSDEKVSTAFDEPLEAKQVERARLEPERDAARRVVENALAVHNGLPGAEPYARKEVPAPRFWQPGEPVVMVPHVREPALLAERDRPVACRLFQAQDGAVWDLTLCEIRKLALELPQPAAQTPWPMFLEWEVAFYPLVAAPEAPATRGTARSLSAEPGRKYPQDFIRSNYRLPAGSVDLQLKEKPVARGAASRGATSRGADSAEPLPLGPEQVYSGSSILSSSAAHELRERLALYLDALRKKTAAKPADGEGAGAPVAILRELLSPFKPPAVKTGDESLAVEAPDAVQVWMDWLDEHVDAIAKDYAARVAADDPLAMVLTVLSDLRGEPFMGQALSGLNDLLLQKAAPQLSGANPLSLAQGAGQPPEFSPLRAGVLELRSLRLVDSYGRTRPLPFEQVIVSEKLQRPLGQPKRIVLPPRLVQPARLNFRWLAAAAGSQGQAEMNVHPATHPICGWLLPVWVDGAQALMVYDPGGQAVGLLDPNATPRWRAAPGSAPIAAEALSNAHLGRVISALAAGGQTSAVADLLAAAETALKRIVPDQAVTAATTAQLVSRPLALVRAGLSLEVYGQPAVRRDEGLAAGPAASHEFGVVEFGVRLGEASQLNDGVVGFWLEDTKGAIDGGFRRPASAAGRDEPDFPLLVDATQTVILLLDPLGEVHATSAILPVKAIDIPPAQYTDLLKRLQLTFRAAPVLSDRGKLSLPFPPEPGDHWLWLNGGAWEPVDGPAPDGALSARQGVREAWVKLAKAEAAGGQQVGVGSQEV